MYSISDEHENGTDLNNYCRRRTFYERKIIVNVKPTCRTLVSGCYSDKCMGFKAIYCKKKNVHYRKINTGYFTERFDRELKCDIFIK